MIELLTQDQVIALMGCSKKTAQRLWARHADILVEGPANERGGGVGGRSMLLPASALPEWARGQFATEPSPPSEENSGTPGKAGSPTSGGCPQFSLDDYLIWKATLPEKMQGLVEERRLVIVRWNRLLAEHTGPDGKLTVKKGLLAERHARASGMSAVSLWRLVERTANGADFYPLAPDWGKRAGNSKLSAFDRAFLKELFGNAKRSGLRAAAIYEIYVNELERQGRTPACENTVRSYLRSAECRMAKSLAAVGRQKFVEGNGAYVSREQPTEPGFAWCSDHRQIDIPVVWHELGVAFPWEAWDGRPRMGWDSLSIRFPWVTAWMDEATFSLTGEVVTDVPNSDSIKRALSRGVKAFGVPRHVLTDNGKDYKHLMLNSDGRVFHRRCLWDDEQNRELLSTVYNHLGVFGRHLSRPRHPQSKRIERFFAFLSLRFDPAIVGWRGRGKGDRVAACDELIKKTREAIANRQPVGLEHGTCMTRAEFEDLWARFVAWDFNRERKTGRMKGFAPKEIWESCKTPIRRVGRDALWFLMLKKEGRVVAKGGRVGMSFGGERVEWFSEPLLDMRGEKVDLRIDPDDLDTVFVCDRDKGALLAVAERITKVPAYEEGEKAVTRRELERVAAVNKRLVRATRELGEAREDARQAVANMGAAEFIGIPRGAEYSATPDLSNRPLTPVQTGFETAAKAAVAGRANVAANVKERSSRRAQDRKDGPMSSLLFSTMTRREAEEPLIPLWKDLSNSPMHLEEGE